MTEQRSRFDAGVCTCGHAPGDHRSVATYSLKVRIGRCYRCDCRSFTPGRSTGHASDAVAGKGHRELDRDLDDALGDDAA